MDEETDRGTGEEKEQEEDERSSDEGFMGMTPLLQAHHAMEKMEEFVHKVLTNTTLGVFSPVSALNLECQELYLCCSINV